MHRFKIVAFLFVLLSTSNTAQAQDINAGERFSKNALHAIKLVMAPKIALGQFLPVLLAEQLAALQATNMGNL